MKHELMTHRHTHERYDVRIVLNFLELVSELSDFLRFHYGAPSDYDEWAALQKGQKGAEDWCYEKLHQ